jgi:hypothetical protein
MDGRRRNFPSHNGSTLPIELLPPEARVLSWELGQSIIGWENLKGSSAEID